MVSNQLKKQILAKRKGLSNKNKISKPTLKKKSKSKSKSPKVPKNQEKEVIEGGDQLRWKNVEIPDTLDDFGGLYGLEEIDGVGVKVVDGKVQFITKEDNVKNAEDEEEVDDKDPFDKDNDVSMDEDEDDEKKDGEEDEEKEDENEEDVDDNEEEEEPKPIEKKSKPVKQEQKSKENSKLEGFGKISNNLNFEEIELPEEEADLPAWSNLDLSTYTLQGLSHLNFTKPTPIQKKCIPICSEGNDIIGKASTGSGKTLAYGIPILERLVSLKDPKFPAGVIFTPTRELAHQVVDHLNKISKFFPSHQSSILSLTGGLSIQKQERILKYENSGQIIVATPGRFLELIERNGEFAKKVSNLEILVLDEADRLLQDGHFDEFEQILKILSTNRTKQDKWQSLVFSATFAVELFSKLVHQGYKPKDEPSKLDEREQIIKILNEKIKFSKKPEFIDLNPNQKLANEITETMVECLPAERDLYLYYFLLMYPGTTLVFTNAIDSVKRLVPYLNNLKIPTFAIHSSMLQKQRLNSIEKFKESVSKNSDPNKPIVLIASDVAARGLDIPGIQHVIHYHLPRSADVYIHRSGRTARSGMEGISVMICSPQEASGPLRNLRKALSNDKTKFKGKSTKKWTKDVERLPIESDIVNQLRERSVLASQLADNEVSTKSLTKEDSWLKQAAEDLDIDMSDMEEDEILKKNRSKKENKRLSSNEISKKKYELSGLLSQNIRKDLRKSYLTGGLINLADSIAKGIGHGNIIGHDKVDALQQLKTNKKNKNKKK
ncbi:ATP-dependent RNA helicase [Wickerhamomyces ciferrii]|uniref:RNA helicase n=1 Tax=Wickerhamomyces ciferrii (strain ATCC 14091 / BCRC 22168 / CBS 111 / JCM 3599 / NBRC 0793 / NRRL Y-1031 F-60-10) TaxID=1206466 RepID=K0KVS2_WICCF|nr:ATP-dependent RNA helicase [Wickerhamomyces ciferrii]CCH45589.1 ATP-dependent RNA helicase [Wickerhamomyces ciferrii]